MPTNAVLMVVTMEVADAESRPLEAWYEHHVPILLSQDGYEWARRYRTSNGVVLAVYALRDRESALRLRPADASARPAALADEIDRFAELEGVRSAITGLYRQRAGAPFVRELMERDSPLSIAYGNDTLADSLRFELIDDERLDQDETRQELAITLGAGDSDFYPLAKYWPRHEKRR